MAKPTTKYVCTECGAEYSKWQGKCTNCDKWDSLEERALVEREMRATKSLAAAASGKLTTLNNVNIDQFERAPTGFGEFDLVLGGGMVPSQVILLSGEPGVGKSTLLLQVLVQLSKQGKSVLYASGEESAGQVAGRAARLYKPADYAAVNFVGAAGVQGVLEHIQQIKPEIVVVDSIQTIFSEDVAGLPGSLSQVKACSAALTTAAKTIGFTLILVGHITKEGNIAGPKVLEHLVDTVLQFEGERSGDYRVIRVLKNRFGSTNDVGIMIMAESGLHDIGPEFNLLSGSTEDTIGAAKTLALEGNRALIIEVQALANQTIFAYPKRVSEGVSNSRLQLLCAILDRFAGANLLSKDVYVRAAGNYRLENPSSDLGVAAALLSSLQNKELRHDELFVGELTLSGKIYLSPQIVSKLPAIAKQGIKRFIMPAGKYKLPSGIEVVQLKSISQLLK